MKQIILPFLRNLSRQKGFAAINLIGLSVGMASAILLFLYVHHELSFDRFHTNAERMYRVNQTFIWGEANDHQFASTGPGVSEAILSDIPEVEQLTRIYTPGDFLFSYTNPNGEITTIDQKKVLAADSNFFSFFSFKLIAGEPTSVLDKAQTMVLTKKVAQKYFGDQNPVGKMIRIGEGETARDFEVTGVVEDIPDHSYIQFDVLMSMESFPVIRRVHWSWIFTQLETFVVLRPDANIESVRAKVAGLPRKYAGTTLERTMNMSFEDYIKSGRKWDLFIQPFLSIHLPEQIVYNRLNDAGSLKVVYALITAAIAMILLSCINFMNLMTAQYTRSARDAAIRKVLGSTRFQLSLAFFREALFFCVLSVAIALTIVEIALPAFNLVTGKQLSLSVLGGVLPLSVLVSMVFGMSLLCGLYPAIFLTSFNPIEAMRGRFRRGKGAGRLRDALVVFQFGISMALLIFTVIVSQQLRFVNSKELGFDRNNLVVIERADWTSAPEAFKQELLNIPGITSASWCTYVPPFIYGGDKFQGEGSTETISINFSKSDANYFKTLGVQLKFGRFFTEEGTADTTKVVLNERAISALGWPSDESVLGKKIYVPGDNNRSFEVIGVTRDFHYWSLLTPIEPMAVFHIGNPIIEGSNRQSMLLRVNADGYDNWTNLEEQIKSTYKKFAGNKPFAYAWLDQQFAESFKSMEKFGSSLGVLSAMAMLVASLGLLGMIIFTLEQRTKEIGIRKISGASIVDILVLVSRDFSILILVAFIISTPLTYLLITNWLNDYAYRITPSPWAFVMAGMITFVMSILITLYHAISAARRNPVEVLRDE